MERARLKALVEATGCARAVGRMLFVLDPGWGPEARREAETLLALPDQRPPEEERGWLALPSGGSGGGVKWARHDEATLAAAVAGLRTHFGLGAIHAVDVLPAHHVSGLMARVRAALTGGTHLPWAWKRLEAGEVPRLPETAGGWVVSLVPTQLQRLLRQPAATAWLRGLRVIFLGGGPAWPDLLRRAREEGLRLAPSYGMTETAAMVAAMRPEQFLAGARHSGSALPHARLSIGADGAIAIVGESVFRGYWPAWRTEEAFTTDDAGSIDADGGITVIGRRDAVIITGGKKVQPERVEAVLKAALGGAEVAVLGVPDPGWGEKVVACVPPAVGALGISADLPGLAPHERPKLWLTVDPWPVNAQGKVNRAALRSSAVARIEAAG